MPYRRKDSPIWWASYTDASGKRVRRSTGTSDRKEATALEAKWKVEAFRTKHWDEQPSRTFDELMLPYLRARSDKRSAKDDLVLTRKLRRVFGGRQMHDVRAVDVRAYIDGRLGAGVQPATVNRELSLLSAAINYANKEWDWALPNPVRGRKLREPEGRVRWLTRDEGAKLVSVARKTSRTPYLADLIQVALNTGMRRGELLGLEWSRVNLQDGLVFLEAVHTKAKRRRSVPLNAMAREALIRRARFRAKHCPGSPWVFATREGKRLLSVGKCFSNACEKAGIQDFRFHDLRHTCAAWLVSAGASHMEVRDLLGHASVTMTERYAHLAPDNVRAAVALLDGQRSRSGHAAGGDVVSKTG